MEYKKFDLERIDERDIIFSRIQYSPSTKAYQDYYGKNPFKEETDRNLRKLNQNPLNQTSLYSEGYTEFCEEGFKLLKSLKTNPLHQRIPQNANPRHSGTIKLKIKTFANFLEADLCHVFKTDENQYYTHQGRPLDDYGKKIKWKYPTGILIGYKTPIETVNSIPRVEGYAGTVKGYMNCGVTALWISNTLNALGYPSKAHIDGNYETIITRVGYDSGIGGIGRNGLLIHKKFGQALRFSIVTTSIPLEADPPASRGKENRLCRFCHRCARYCPGKAIDNSKFDPDHPERINFSAEKCFEVWTKFGTDCGICMSICPFTEGLLADMDESFFDSDQEIMDFIKNKQINSIKKWNKKKLTFQK